jgi:two-component sensor histidine kinase
MSMKKTHLRSHIYRSAIIAILGCGIATALVVLSAGEFLFRKAYIAARNTSFSDAQGRFEIFDHLISGADARIRAITERALIELGRRYPDSSVISSTTAATLRAEARRLGVSDVYLAGPNGHIRATSFEEDFSIDLFSFGEKTAQALRALYGAGRVAHQSPSQSSRTGIMGSYHYYSPPGSDILIEVSVSLRDAMSETGSGDYDEFLKIVLVGGTEGLTSGAGDSKRTSRSFLNIPGLAVPSYAGSGQRSLVRIADLVGMSGGTVWSFAHEGRERPELMPLVAEASERDTAQVTRDGLQTLVLKLTSAGDSNEVAGERRYAVLELDLEPLRHFRFVVVLAAAAACLLSAAIAFYTAKRAFDRSVARRVERLEATAARIASGDYDAVIDEPGEDEISSIARAIAGMVRLIAEGNKELKSSLQAKEELLREVHHRVKNNLQVIESLVSLQMNEASGQEALRFLGATRTRIHTMALVHEQLYRSESLASVDLGACLSGIVADIAQGSRHSGSSISARIDTGGLALSADRALPACLAAAELLLNCYEHAFDGRATGSIVIRSVDDERGGFVLSVEDDGVGAGPDPIREGLGLGIARILATQLGGELRRESPEGGGERFVVDASR